MEYLEGILPSLKIAYMVSLTSMSAIPFTQIFLLILTGSVLSLAYTLKKEIDYLSAKLDTLNVDVKCANAIALLCDDEIGQGEIKLTKVSENMNRLVGLLEMYKECLDVILKKHELLNHDTAFRQQWYGVLRGETSYGSIELKITITNTEVYTKHQNSFWMSDTSGSSNTYIDSIVNDVVSIKKVPKPDTIRSLSRDFMGFSGSIRATITWNDVGRYYELEEYFKKYLVQWEKRLVPPS